MKRLNNYYKRLLSEDDHDLGWGTENERPNNNSPNLSPTLPWSTPIWQDPPNPNPTYPGHGQWTPDNYPWLQDIYQNNPNFDGWNHDGWTTAPDGTPKPPKDWPYIVDPDGVHPPIPLPPGRPVNYPPNRPWPPPPGDPYYKYIKHALELLESPVFHTIPRWIRNYDDLKKYFEKKINYWGISREVMNNTIGWLLFILQIWASTRGGAGGETFEYDWAEHVDLHPDPNRPSTPNIFGIKHNTPRPYNWPSNQPWPPRTYEDIPPGWYQDENGEFYQSYPSHFPSTGSIKWVKVPPPAHWQWLPYYNPNTGQPLNPNQFPMIWDPVQGWHLDPNHAPPGWYPPPPPPRPQYHGPAMPLHGSHPYVM